jgi:hypothetical protein
MLVATVMGVTLHLTCQPLPVGCADKVSGELLCADHPATRIHFVNNVPPRERSASRRSNDNFIWHQIVGARPNGWLKIAAALRVPMEQISTSDRVQILTRIDFDVVPRCNRHLLGDAVEQNSYPRSCLSHFILLDSRIV